MLIDDNLLMLIMLSDSIRWDGIYTCNYTDVISTLLVTFKVLTRFFMFYNEINKRETIV